MNKVLIVIAYYKEINEHKNQVGKLWKVNDKVDICISGIGLRDFFVDLSKYDKVYNVGTCGAIPDKAKVGDIIFPGETGGLLAQLQNFYGLKKQKTLCRQGVCKTMDYACEKVPSFLPNYKMIDIVDMEYELLLRLCLKAKKQLIAVKVVSDTIGRKHKDIDVCVVNQRLKIKNIIKNILYLEEK